tara:strand:+ start:138 stop:569 length:432 start_codon:yes stop_codon:yes gene_type:complete
MSIVDYCGNPTKDREQAQMRFESIFKPVLENIGFKQIGRSNNMWKEKTNQIVIVSSAPSNLKVISALKTQIRKFRKNYNNPFISVVFTREISTYPDGSKETYLQKLNKICGMNLLSGVSVGSSLLPMLVDKLKSNEAPFRLIT